MPPRCPKDIRSMSNNQTDAGPAPPMVAPPQDYIVWLDDPRALSSALVGGKGSNLARLVRERFCVPPGFVMSAGAVGLQQRHLKARIEQTAATYSGSSAISDRIQQMVIEEPVDPELSEAFRNAYRELMIRCGRETMVAVRSSAIAEDLPGASFAGQHDTFLGMRGEEEVLKAVVKCLASAWSARALEYRARMGVEEAVPAFAIIVQQQVDAEVSGVMFTVNPIDSSTEELVITASYGLGEAIVSGAVTPDTFIIEKAGRIRNRTLGAKQSMTPPTGSGSTTVPQQLRSQYALADQDVLSLAKLGVKIERTFGSPQDIEWSITGAKTYVLQSRPITAWRLREDLDQSGSRLSFAQRVFLERSPMLPNFTDHFPDPLTALDFTTIVRSVWFGIASTLTWLGFRVRSIDEILPATEDGSIRLVPGPPRPRLRVLAMPFRLYQALRLDAEKEWLMEDLPFIEALERSLPKLDLPSAPALDLVRALVQMQGFLEVVCVRRFRKYFVAGLLYGAMLRLLVRTVEESAEVSETMQALHSGIAHNASLMNRDVADLVQFG